MGCLAAFASETLLASARAQDAREKAAVRGQSPPAFHHLLAVHVTPEQMAVGRRARLIRFLARRAEAARGDGPWRQSRQSSLEHRLAGCEVQPLAVEWISKHDKPLHLKLASGAASD